MSTPPQEDLVGGASRKAARLSRARRSRPLLWATLARVIGLGWVFILPLVVGAALGRLIARSLGRPWIALVGLALGLFSGVYGVFRQVKGGLADDSSEGGGKEP